MKIKERYFVNILPLYCLFSHKFFSFSKKKNSSHAFCISTTKSLRIKRDLNERGAYVNTTTFELEMGTIFSSAQIPTSC